MAAKWQVKRYAYMVLFGTPQGNIQHTTWKTKSWMGASQYYNGD